jgi:hypothetical protein
MQMNTSEFTMDKTRKDAASGFVPLIVEAIGYGIAFDKDGLLPIPTAVNGEDNVDCYCKAVKFECEDEFVYYVRSNTRGDFADPWGIYADSYQNAKMAEHRGEPLWRFKRVTESVFLTYTKYLATRNSAYLRTSQRDHKDNPL